MQSLGVKVVTSAGTPVQLSTSDLFCDEVIFVPMQSLGAAGTPTTENAEPLYVMNSNVAKSASSTNIILPLQPGQPGTSLRSRKDKGLNLKNMWIDADTSGDGVHVSFI